MLRSDYVNTTANSKLGHGGSKEKEKQLSNAASRVSLISFFN